MSTPRAVLIKGPSVNSRVYMTALPEQHESLLNKARELFHVPEEHTPYLCVAAPAVSGSPVSDARGAILMPDAMPFIRDREILTLRWAPTSPRRMANRVHWDSQLEYDTPRCEQRGPEYRSLHVARTLERERRTLLPLSPKKMERPLSPPMSSPDGPEDCPGSPTPLRGGSKSLWADEGELPVPETVLPEAEIPSPRRTDTRSRLSTLSSWCTLLNPFSRGQSNEETPAEQTSGQSNEEAPAERTSEQSNEEAPTEQTSEQSEERSVVGAVDPDSEAAEPAKTTPPATISIMTKVLEGLREHPCNVHLKEHMSEEFMRFSAERGRAVNLHTIGERIARNEFPPGAALGHFVKDLTLFWENVRTYYGSETAQAQEATSLGRFATMLLGELQRPQTKRAAATEEEPSSPTHKRTRRGIARAPYVTRRMSAR